MDKKRLLFFNDARHYYLYCYEPPISLEDAVAPIDEIAGTGVDTFVYGIGCGPEVFYPSRFVDMFGGLPGSFIDTPGVLRGTLPKWRAYENLVSLCNRGTDPLKLLIDRAHQKGLQFYASLRTTLQLGPKIYETYYRSVYKADNLEQLTLKGKGKGNFSWVFPEVRQERMTLIEEIIERYDIDGFEIDWLYLPIYFEENEVTQKSHILTDFTQDGRRLLERKGREQGKKLGRNTIYLVEMDDVRVLHLGDLGHPHQKLVDCRRAHRQRHGGADDAPYHGVSDGKGSPRCTISRAGRRSAAAVGRRRRWPGRRRRGRSRATAPASSRTRRRPSAR